MTGDPAQQAISDVLSIMGRLDSAIHGLYAQQREPEWIIMGQRDWMDFTRDARQGWLDMAWQFEPKAIPTYRGIRIATVLVADYLEVIPRDPYR